MKLILTLSKKNCRNLHLHLQLTRGRTLFQMKRVEVFESLPLGALGLTVLLSVILSINFNDWNFSRRVESKISKTLSIPWPFLSCLYLLQLWSPSLLLFKSLGFKGSITELLLTLLSYLPGISCWSTPLFAFHTRNPYKIFDTFGFCQWRLTIDFVSSVRLRLDLMFSGGPLILAH